jgi:Ca2+-binding EF-hand superfamily protein
MNFTLHCFIAVLPFPSQVASGEICVKQLESRGDDYCHAGLDSKSFHQEKQERAMASGRYSQNLSGGGGIAKQERAAAFGRISQSFCSGTAKASTSLPSDHFSFEFDRMDKNKDGWLSPSELHSALLSSGWEQDQVCKLFDLIDVDHDGRITKPEYVSFRLKSASNAKSKQRSSICERNAPVVMNPKDRNHLEMSFEFDRIDKNKDGWLSIGELHQGLLCSGWGQDEICQLFDIIDTNKDGRITKAEFLAFKAKTWGHPLRRGSV